MWYHHNLYIARKKAMMNLQMAIKWSCFLYADLTLSVTWKRRHYVIRAEKDGWDAVPIGVSVTNISKEELNDMTHYPVRVATFDLQHIDNILPSLIEQVDYVEMLDRFTRNNIGIPNYDNEESKKRFIERTSSRAVKTRALLYRFRTELYGFMKIINERLDKHTYLAYQPVALGGDPHDDTVTVFEQNVASKPLFPAALAKNDFLEVYVDFDWDQDHESLMHMCGWQLTISSHAFQRRVANFVSKEWAERMFIEQTYLEAQYCIQHVNYES